ncbi:MAG: phosphodiesterase [Flammeovirgaceae bacterium]|nr:phosphodiesterase [Flammeovirgaceae bacterium]MDW8287636.1 phosphodiesterase [Flammeovirgaceae bacterium]
MKSKPLLTVIQLSDLHLLGNQEGNYRGVQSVKNLFAVVKYILSHYAGKDGVTILADLILLSGDISEDKSQNSYVLADQVLRPLDMPKLWLAGNHDSWQLMQRSSQKARIKTFRVFDKNGVLIILLNTTVPDEDKGYLSNEELQFLRETLEKNPQKTTLIFMHHHPIAVGVAWMDDLMLQNANDFFEIVGKFPQVKGVFYGHVHHAGEVEREGIIYYSSPATSVQFDVSSPSFAISSTLPSFSLIKVFENGELQREIIQVESL